MKNEVIIGDCAEVLKQFPDESIDAVITDPPYGINFMGKSWDKALPSLEALKECCRVLKAGAFGFFMCAPRQDVLSRMIIRLEDAGFNVNFSSMFHAYSSGFPKSMSISKAIDRRNGRSFNPDVKNYLNLKRNEKELSFNQINEYLGTATNGGGVASALMGDKQFNELPTLEVYNKLKELLDLDSRFDELIEMEEAEREIIGKKDYTVPKELYQVGLPKEGIREEAFITAPATDKAREFSGAFAGNSLKPAVEIIIVVMKNLDCKTYIDQALKNGHGCTWLDSCKIPTEENLNGGAYAKNPTVREDAWSSTRKGDINSFKRGCAGEYNQPTGRFPANLLVSDSCLDRGIITKSRAGIRRNNSVLGVNTKDDTTTLGLGDAYSGCNDSGDFSRYFSLDAWFDKKISELPEHIQKTFPFLITPKPSKSEKNKYIENKHPTVKPLKLMSYLITMGSREGDVILDPFAGSGTTLEACKLLNRVFIGIDKDPANEAYMRARGRLDEITLETFQEVKS